MPVISSVVETSGKQVILLMPYVNFIVETDAISLKVNFVISRNNSNYFLQNTVLLFKQFQVQEVILSSSWHK